MAKILVIIIVVIFFYALFNVSWRKASTDQKNDDAPKPGGTRYGKWIGGGLGWAFGGPIGAILGFAMGSMFDGANIQKTIYQGNARGDFAMSLLVLSAAVMKADGKVVKSELDFVKSFFIRQFGLEESEKLIPLLKEILNQEINIQDVSIQIGQYMDYSSRLQLIHYLFGIASADGQYHPSEVDVIGTISSLMGIQTSEFASIKAMFVKDMYSAYNILEVTPDANDDEIKKAYRRLAIQYHPDKVAHLGEDIRKSATEKFQQLNAAYEEIKKQRGIR
jgi:DnaJ like chaperone protein